MPWVCLEEPQKMLAVHMNRVDVFAVRMVGV